MTENPISQDVGSAIGKFFFGGAGPSHSQLTRVFMAGGYGDDDPYVPAQNGRLASPNKQERVLRVFAVATRKPNGAKALIEAMLSELRTHGCFTEGSKDYNSQNTQTVRRAFARIGWTLSEEGMLSPLAGIDLSTGGRDALDEQLARMRASIDDPGLLIGSAKDVLEAVAKFVLEELNFPMSGKESFNQLWYMARDRLGLLPNNIDPNIPGHQAIREVLQASWKIADQVNELRKLQGTGHGRTLPTGVSRELALLVVRESCSVAEFLLTSLDRALGRKVGV